MTPDEGQGQPALERARHEVPEPRGQPGARRPFDGARAGRQSGVRRDDRWRGRAGVHGQARSALGEGVPDTPHRQDEAGLAGSSSIFSRRWLTWTLIVFSSWSSAS